MTITGVEIVKLDDQAGLIKGRSTLTEAAFTFKLDGGDPGESNIDVIECEILYPLLRLTQKVTVKLQPSSTKQFRLILFTCTDVKLIFRPQNSRSKIAGQTSIFEHVFFPKFHDDNILYWIETASNLETFFRIKHPMLFGKCQGTLAELKIDPKKDSNAHLKTFHLSGDETIVKINEDFKERSSELLLTISNPKFDDQDLTENNEPLILDGPYPNDDQHSGGRTNQLGIQMLYHDFLSAFHWMSNLNMDDKEPSTELHHFTRLPSSTESKQKKLNDSHDQSHKDKSKANDVTKHRISFKSIPQPVAFILLACACILCIALYVIFCTGFGSSSKNRPDVKDDVDDDGWDAKNTKVMFMDNDANAFNAIRKLQPNEQEKNIANQKMLVKSYGNSSRILFFLLLSLCFYHLGQK